MARVKPQPCPVCQNPKTVRAYVRKGNVPTAVGWWCMRCRTVQADRAESPSPDCALSTSDCAL